jgi:hypothetical protein
LLEASTVNKATLGTVLALTALVSVTGCAKKETTAPAASPASPMAGMQPGQPHPAPTAGEAANVDLTGIAKADGGKTVAEVYGEKAALTGQPVTVRGKVVKTNAGIMGKNWVHVRDGSGEEGSNDLTVTTAAGALPNVGDVVVVTGTVAVDKDFGMGYQYPVLVEEATIVVEPAAQ